MAEKPDFDKIFANKATSVHEWDKDDYDTGWGFLGETPPPYELFDALQRENDNKTKYLSKRTEDINTDLTQDINNLQSDLNNKYNELKTGLGSTNTALQQHNVDEDAHANLFQRALVTEAKTAANTADWNTLTESRTYKISGATFAADKHQPVGAIGTGELVVLKNGDDTIVQVYYANSTEFDKAGAYHRVNVGGAWTDWVYNITNKGGTVTGDFNINGKLTVNEVQVTDRLLIGEVDPTNPDTSNFLTKDDLQKLQDQIIAPNQSIYVNAINGNDDNDGTSSSKAVRTLNKAYELIKKTVPEITIFLYNGQEGITYEAYPLDMVDEGYSTEQLNFKVLITSSNTIKPTIKLNFGQVKGRGGYSSSGKYGHPMVSGNIFVQGTSNLYINIEHMNIEANTSYMPITADYRNYIVKANRVRFLSCTFNFSKYTFVATHGSDATIEITYCTFKDTSDNYLIRYYLDFPEQWEDETDYEAPVTISANEGAFVMALSNSTNIPSAIKALGNGGIAPSVGVIKKNWS